jgi:PAB-dependent poly(A)-specific ribonuclease subunit 3
LDHELTKEWQNGRYFRLLCKLAVVLDRPEHDSDHGKWAETGDRFLMKLFRNFVFHQV